jgi:hypothetical protein
VAGVSPDGVFKTPLPRMPESSRSESWLSIKSTDRS